MSDVGTAWHALSTDSVLPAEQVDEREGLSTTEVQARTQRFGPNKFDSGKAESRWRAFLRQDADPMQIVLLVAGVGSLYPAEGAGHGHLATAEQWLICSCAGLAIVVVSEFRKAVRRRAGGPVPAGPESPAEG
jgi:magnesium-transporting ATPase (P-type)